MSSSRSKKSIGKIVVFSLAALLILASVLVFTSLFTSIDGSFYRTNATELDLSGKAIDDFSALEQFSSLETLDVRDTGITLDEYLSLKNTLADCDIRWSVSLGDEYFDSSSTEIKIENASAVTAEQLEAVKYMPALTSLDLSGVGVNSSAAEKLNQLSSEYPGCTFIWDIDFCGNLLSNDTVLVRLAPEDDPSEYQKLLLLDQLATVDASRVAVSDELTALLSQLASRNAVWTVSVAGLEFKSDVQEADISGHIIDDLEAFSKALSSLPELRKLEMCNCGLTNEQMEILMAAHPSVKFVWTVSFARWTDIRTDITCFSSLNHSKQYYGQDELAPLFKYCTDLVALDLGHSSIKDISLITNLTKLQALILGDNDITDITPLGELKELEYLELWKNEFDDVSVLTTLPNLKDINLSYCNRIKSFEPLLNLPCVEMLWLQNSGFAPSLVDQLEEKYPDCMFSFYVYNSSHSNGWCAQDRYLGIRKAFANWRNVVNYVSWDNVEYREGVHISEPVPKWGP